MKPFHLVSALFLTWIVLSLSPSPCQAQETLNPVVKIDTPCVLAQQPQILSVLLHFSVSEQQTPSTDRGLLNLGLVIDRSGSMAEKKKLDYAKQAAMELIGKLKKNDIIGIVQYDDRVETLWPSAPVANRDAIRHIISTLVPGGSTNLAGGMMEGGRQVRDNRFDGIRRVLLMSDGLANAGVSDRSSIARMAASLRRQGVAVTTLGLGLDYDEDLMQAVAENGGGNYYYIEHPSQLARVFAQELGVLSSLVTRKFSLQFQWGDSVTGVRVVGYPSKDHGRSTVVEMTDFHAGEERTLLLQVEVAAGAPGVQNLGRFQLAFEDLLQASNRKLCQEVLVTRVLDQEQVRRNEDRMTAVESRLIIADQEHEETVRLFEQGKIPEAKTRMAAMEQSLAGDLETFQNVKLREKLAAVRMEKNILNQAEKDENYRKGYLKKRKADFYRSKQGQREAYLMMVGAKGEPVTALQQALKTRGFYKEKPHGLFDEPLRQAVEDFQRSVGLPADGIAGPRTLKEMNLY